MLIMNNYLSIVGLFLNIIGTLIIIKYGVPNDLKKNGEGFLLLEQEDKKEKNKYQEYKKLQNIGLIYLLIGFILQLFSQLNNY